MGLLSISLSTDPFHERGISMILCAPRLHRLPRPGLPLVLNGLNLTVRAGSWKGGFVDGGEDDIHIFHDVLTVDDLKVCWFVYYILYTL